MNPYNDKEYLEDKLSIVDVKDRDYHAYQARQNFIREQLTIQHELDEERKAKAEAIQQKDAALQREKAALDELERLRVLLAKNNLH